MVRKSEFIWNSIASCVAAILNAVVLFVCTRTNGTEIAGMFSIAFATSTILNAVGDYGIRIYQVTDSKRKYAFGDYLGTRIVITSMMCLLGIAFVWISGYELEKAIMCICLILFRLVDNLSETYQAEFQIQGKLELGAISVVIRNIFSLLCFAIVDFITKNVILAFVTLFVVNAVVFALFDLQQIKHFTVPKVYFQKSKIIRLMKECFPVFLATILSVYLANAVKYAIDTYGNYEMQTIYNIIYLPAFTINLASLFIIKPLLKPLGELWNSHQDRKMFQLIGKVILLIIGVTVLIIVVCATIGIPILQWIYGIPLHMYLPQLLTLVVSGGFYAFSILLLYVLTTIRKQEKATIAYAVTAILAIVICNIFVKAYGLTGASVANLCINIMLCLIMSILFVFAYKKEKKRRNLE